MHVKLNNYYLSFFLFEILVFGMWLLIEAFYFIYLFIFWFAFLRDLLTALQNILYFHFIGQETEVQENEVS